MTMVYLPLLLNLQQTMYFLPQHPSPNLRHRPPTTDPRGHRIRISIHFGRFTGGFWWIPVNIGSVYRWTSVHYIRGFWRISVHYIDGFRWIPVDSGGLRLIPMNFSGFLRFSLDSSRLYLWISVDNGGFQWIPVHDIVGFPWLLVDSFKYWWISVDSGGF